MHHEAVGALCKAGSSSEDVETIFKFGSECLARDDAQFIDDAGDDAQFIEALTDNLASETVWSFYSTSRMPELQDVGHMLRLN